MTQQFPDFNTKLDKTMNSEQFELVVEAILAGKYSWACFLILRFTGYNPIHYIPYRTYKRLIRENRQSDRASKNKIAESNCSSLHNCLDETSLPDNLDRICKQQTQVGNDTTKMWLDEKLQEINKKAEGRGQRAEG